MEKFTFFDFDGTLTRHNSLFLFIFFTSGPIAILRHIFSLLRIILLWKLKIVTAQQGKEKILSIFFLKWDRKSMFAAGNAFSEVLLQRFFRPEALKTLQIAQSEGRKIVIVSASPEEWISPIAEKLYTYFVCTRLEYDDKGNFTGFFKGKNCSGMQKVIRIREQFPNIEHCEVEVYGDSEGDIPMFSLANEHSVHYKPFRGPWRSLFELARPYQWIKNGFVFLPAFFSERIFEPSTFLLSVLCFFTFSFCASAIYMLNDFIDRDEDRNHPTKKYRPIARGSVPPQRALFCAVVCIIFGMGICFYLSKPGLFCLISYLLLIFFYVFIGKQKALLDIICISLGYVLRVLTAIIIIHAEISHWLILMVFLLSMFLAIGKRFDDISKIDHKKINGNIKKSLIGYSKNFVISSLTFLSSINTVCYILYSMDPTVNIRFNTTYLFLTSFWVIIGNLRYLQLLMVEDKGLSPTKILSTDIGIQLCVVAWFIHLFFIIY